jgi:hypothetical protein
MEKELKELVKYAEIKFAEIDKMPIDARALGTALGVIKVIKEKLEEITNK